MTQLADGLLTDNDSLASFADQSINQWAQSNLFINSNKDKKANK